jgi:4-azaleucine resistance transporter AzlC
VKEKVFSAAFRATIPVLLGYLAIGLAFGMLLCYSGLPMFLAPLMSILIYAGAGQFVGIGLLSTNAGLAEIATVILLVNARHTVYGLSLLEKFKGTGPYKPYLIFALTDETYGLLTTIDPPQGIDRGRFYFLVALLNHSYWVTASILGYIAGSYIPISMEGLEFALTALFVVLLIEQIKSTDKAMPFFIAGISSVAGTILFPENMLIMALAISIVILLISMGGWRRNGD